jgi:hypothetical protein
VYWMVLSGNHLYDQWLEDRSDGTKLMALQLDLLLSVLDRVGSVADVTADGQSEVAADGT